MHSTSRPSSRPSSHVSAAFAWLARQEQGIRPPAPQDDHQSSHSSQSSRPFRESIEIPVQVGIDHFTMHLIAPSEWEATPPDDRLPVVEVERFSVSPVGSPAWSGEVVQITPDGWRCHWERVGIDVEAGYKRGLFTAAQRDRWRSGDENWLA